MKIKCITIDDSPLALEKLQDFISQVSYLELEDSFTNAIEALGYIKTYPVDLIFLDIQMEKLNGLQFLKSLETMPQVIIVSAYSEYAIEGFNYQVTDYLLKPFSFERFLLAVSRVMDKMSRKFPKEFMFVKTEYRMERVNFKDILYIESVGAYMKIVTPQSKIMTLQSFKDMIEILPSNQFMRVHRSYIIPLDKIQVLEKGSVIIGDKRIPIGEIYKTEFSKYIESLNK